uniref:Uncharacterized protein n=1 Tax=Nelumbo nucifera TaxID=4432 RepID=A0A822XYQ9_NELNU|nr:TPA_asm: hypothetical protein HUJ06_025702 [Nelumbo nucifera]
MRGAGDTSSKKFGPIGSLKLSQSWPEPIRVTEVEPVLSLGRVIESRSGDFLNHHVTREERLSSTSVQSVRLKWWARPKKPLSGVQVPAPMGIVEDRKEKLENLVVESF